MVQFQGGFRCLKLKFIWCSDMTERASTLIHPLKTKFAVLGWLKARLGQIISSKTANTSSDMERDWKPINIHDY